MNDQNLLPINPTRAREMGLKGGAVKSAMKSLAATLRELKKKGLTDETSKKLYELMKNPEYSALDMRLVLDQLHSKAVSQKERLEAARLLLEWNKWYHGNKVKVEHEGKIDVEITDYKFTVDMKLVDIQKPGQAELIIEKPLSEVEDGKGDSRDPLGSDRETTSSVQSITRQNDN